MHLSPVSCLLYSFIYLFIYSLNAWKIYKNAEQQNDSMHELRNIKNELHELKTTWDEFCQVCTSMLCYKTIRSDVSCDGIGDVVR